MKIKIAIADDHNIFRKGIRSILEERDDIVVVGEACDGRSAIELCMEQSVDVLLMDISMPGMNGIDTTRQLLKKNPEVKVIALSMHSDRRFILDMLKAGARGYVVKDCEFDELVRAIHFVGRNKVYLSPEIADVVVDDYRYLSGEAATIESDSLTPREKEVLQYVVKGDSCRDIADSLHLSVKTVEAHRGNIMRKLGTKNLPELTKYAIREGLITL